MSGGLSGNILPLYLISFKSQSAESVKLLRRPGSAKLLHGGDDYGGISQGLTLWSGRPEILSGWPVCLKTDFGPR